MYGNEVPIPIFKAAFYPQATGEILEKGRF